LKWKS
jgi:hypothetical protein